MSPSSDISGFFCTNKDCRDYGRRSRGNIVQADRYGRDRRRLLKCRTCNQRFSERRIKPFFGLHTDEGKVKEVMGCLIDGKSLRETAKTAGIDKDTVHRIWRKFLSHFEESMDEMVKELNMELDDIIALLYMRSSRRAAGGEGKMEVDRKTVWAKR
jgi:transposase-like protein